MESNEISEYQERCREFLQGALDRPAMYYKSLADLDWMLLGHAIAHEQMGLIERKDSFNFQFCNWIYGVYQISCSTGWAEAFETMSNGQPSRLPPFEKAVVKFLEQWKGPK